MLHIEILLKFKEENMDSVFKYLDNLNIKYEVVYHPAVITTDEADKYVEGKEGVLTKTLFMAGKKDRNFCFFCIFYLFIHFFFVCLLFYPFSIKFSMIPMMLLFSSFLYKVGVKSFILFKAFSMSSTFFIGIT